MATIQNLIKIEELIPFKKLKKFETGAELVLAYALNDYAIKYLNARLDCTNVRVSKDLVKEEIFAYICDYSINPENIVFNSLDVPENRPRYSFRPTRDMNLLDSLVINMTPEKWVFGIANDNVKNSQIRVGVAAWNYCYIVAKWLIWRYLNKNMPVPKLIIDQQRMSITRYEYSLLIILIKYGNQILNIPEFELVYDNPPNDDYEWVAFVEEKRMRGMMHNIPNTYSAKDKIVYMTKRLKLAPGDVVLLFRRRDNRNNGDITQNLIDVYPAVIMSVTAEALTLQYCTQTDLTLTRKHHLDMLRMNGGHRIYTARDYTRFEVQPRRFEWFDIGIEGFSSTELWFIIPMVRDDSTVQYINDGEKDCMVTLDTVETVYALFEDRGIKYDKARYLEKNYPNGEIPIWDQFKAKREAVKAAKANNI